VGSIFRACSILGHPELCRGSFMSRLALRVMRSCGVFALTRAWSAKMARILMYHNFSGPGGTDPNALNVEGIRSQFEYLRRHFRVVPVLHVAERLASGRELPANMVALTIDDGRRNGYEFLFPLLKEFELPATLFVVSSFIRGDDWIWTDKVLWLSQQPRPPQELASGQLDDAFRWLNRLRPEQRNARIEAMAKAAGVSIPQRFPPRYAPCSWSELREMADSGLLEIGSHSATHPIFSSVTDEESWEELRRSRAQIEQGMGRGVRCFCFPNGMPGDFRPSQVRQVQEAGYDCSVTAEFGMVSRGSDRYQLPRIGMARKSSPIEIAKYLDGFAYFQQRVASGLRTRHRS
jgi:peptidoglycan/xylan/chitin deacetylase (PgdA/CDA1 family)